MDLEQQSVGVPFLIKALGRTEGGICEAACKALGALEADSLDAVPALVQIVVSDSGEEVRKAALRALLKIQGHEASVKQLSREASDQQSFPTFLASGGKEFRELRQCVAATWRRRPTTCWHQTTAVRVLATALGSE